MSYVIKFWQLEPGKNKPDSLEETGELLSWLWKNIAIKENVYLNANSLVAGVKLRSGQVLIMLFPGLFNI